MLFAKFFGATVPLLTQDTWQFYGLLTAYVILLLGCYFVQSVIIPSLIDLLR